jgi:type IV secretory pathway VirB10-like protein
MNALAADALDPFGTDAPEPTRKLSLLKSGPGKDIYSRHGPQTPASPHQLMVGTILSASPVSGLNSDLPGLVITQVAEDVFDTVSGRFRPILQGSRLIACPTTS